MDSATEAEALLVNLTRRMLLHLHSNHNTTPSLPERKIRCKAIHKPIRKSLGKSADEGAGVRFVDGHELRWAYLGIRGSAFPAGLTPRKSL